MFDVTHIKADVETDLGVVWLILSPCRPLWWSAHFWP